MNPAFIGQAVGQSLGIINEVIGDKTSGYSQIYPVQERSNTYLFLILALFIMAIAVTLIFVFKKGR